MKIETNDQVRKKAKLKYSKEREEEAGKLFSTHSHYTCEAPVPVMVAAGEDEDTHSQSSQCRWSHQCYPHS